MKVANDMIADHGPVRLLDIEVEDARLFVIDPDDGVIVIRHRGSPCKDWRLSLPRPARLRYDALHAEGCQGGAGGRRSADKAASYEIGEDEAGMRLDRWLHRRFPDVANSHLMRIVRKGEVRVSGKRADISTRLASGESVRVPPLRIAPQGAPAIKRANPGDAEAIRAMILFEDRDVMVLNKPYGLAVQGGSGTTRHIDGMLQALADKGATGPFSSIGSTATRRAFC